jgi:ferredoxin
MVLISHLRPHICTPVSISVLSVAFISHKGACEGSVACSTCHIILPPEYYDLLPEPEDDENDMLDMAFGLTDTSRLGCQVKLTRALDGLTATLPSATRNMFVDGEHDCRFRFKSIPSRARLTIESQVKNRHIECEMLCQSNIPDDTLSGCEFLVQQSTQNVS